MSDKKTYKILIVDDEDAIRTTYAEVFKTEGFEVVEAMDGLDGLDKALHEKPDIIFTGIIMPKMDGFALKEELAKNIVTSNIPVMMSSHMGRKEDHIRAKEMGVKDFIVQGMVTPKDVVERAESILDTSNTYDIKFDPEDIDAFKLANDLKISNGYICEKCGSAMILSLEVINPDTKELKARFICPKCDR